jgi:hypothetical protein
MELKVYVDDNLLTVCGINWETCVKDVIIALAFSIQQTGRFYLIEKLVNLNEPISTYRHRILKQSMQNNSEPLSRIMAPNERPIENLSNYFDFLKDDEDIEYYLVRSFKSDDVTATNEDISKELIQIIHRIDRKTNHLHQYTNQHQQKMYQNYERQSPSNIFLSSSNSSSASTSTSTSSSTSSNDKKTQNIFKKKKSFSMKEHDIDEESKHIFFFI